MKQIIEEWRFHPKFGIKLCDKDSPWDEGWVKTKAEMRALQQVKEKPQLPVDVPREEGFACKLCNAIVPSLRGLRTHIGLCHKLTNRITSGRKGRSGRKGKKGSKLINDLQGIANRNSQLAT